MIQSSRRFRATIFIAACVCFCLSSQAQNPPPDPIDKTLSAIDSKDFMDGLFGPASGMPGVEFQAERSPQVQYLVQHSREAIPRMVRLLNEKGAIRYRLTPIVYFIVFKQAKDARAMPALADYADSLSDSDRQWAATYFEENPFAYAVEAIATFITLPLAASSDPFRDRHQIAAQLRAEFKRRQPQ